MSLVKCLNILKILDMYKLYIDGFVDKSNLLCLIMCRSKMYVL